jgi:hypothetical protein
LGLSRVGFALPREALGFESSSLGVGLRRLGGRDRGGGIRFALAPGDVGLLCLRAEFSGPDSL